MSVPAPATWFTVASRRDGATERMTACAMLERCVPSSCSRSQRSRSPAPPSAPPSGERDAKAPTRVELSGYARACELDQDCALVKPDPCSHCGCASEPISQHELARFEHERDAIVCPSAERPEDMIDCGGCPGYRTRCQDARCVAEMF